MDADQMAFELEWTKRKLDGAIQSESFLLRENDILKGMVEMVVNEFNHYSVGDLWTQEDMILVRDLEQQLEELE